MIYAYSGPCRRTTYISDADLNWRGTWASGTTYSPPADAVTTNGAMWLALAPTTNVSPTAVMRQRAWAQLVYYQEGPEGTNQSEAAYQLAASAYALATTASGQAAAAQADADTALQTLSLGASGTTVFWVAPASGLAATTQVTVVNGVIVVDV